MRSTASTGNEALATSLSPTRLSARTSLLGAGLVVMGIAGAQPAVTIQPPNLSGGIAGSLSGRAGVSPGGAATYVVPIAIPPGTAGVAPTLTFSYSSQGPRGPLARGWNIGGLSAITRCPRILVQDGVSGAVTLTSSDQFCVEGQRLLLVAGTVPSTAPKSRPSGSSFRAAPTLRRDRTPGRRMPRAGSSAAPWIRRSRRQARPRYSPGPCLACRTARVLRTGTYGRITRERDECVRL